MLNEITSQIEDLILNKQFPRIKSLLPEHPEDSAHIISSLSKSSYRMLIFRMIPPDRATKVFEYLPVDEQEELLAAMTVQESRSILNQMSPDDRTELFEDMPAELVKRFISVLSPEERVIALELLNYPEDSVGRLITPDYVQLYEDMTVKEAIEHIRKVAITKETIYHCYVLDRQKRLIGVVSLKKIVLAEFSVEISKLMFRDVIKARIDTDQEEAANIFKRYDVIALPVVDLDDKLLGIVTFDDLVDVIEDEATEDFERIAAVLPVDKPYMEAKFFNIVWKRSFWLIVLAVFESVSGVILQKYGWMIHEWVALTFFLPVLIAAGGNAGTQSATIIIRGIAVGDIKLSDFFRVIFRESVMGLLIGAILALVGVIRVMLQQNSWQLSVAVGVSMGVTIFIAATAGALFPLIFRKLKIDPALMSGPLISTIVDVLGILVYFEIARLILRF